MSMRYGEYQVVITGPQGVVLDAAVGLSGRTLARLALDDEALPELLIVTSVCAGTVEGEIHAAQRRFSRGECAAPAAPEMVDGRSEMGVAVDPIDGVDVTDAGGAP
jgi:hypothetical protein